jgi:hypothetical protein
MGKQQDRAWQRVLVDVALDQLFEARDALSDQSGAGFRLICED